MFAWFEWDALIVALCLSVFYLSINQSVLLSFFSFFSPSFFAPHSLFFSFIHCNFITIHNFTTLCIHSPRPFPWLSPPCLFSVPHSTPLPLPRDDSTVIATTLYSGLVFYFLFFPFTSTRDHHPSPRPHSLHWRQ